MPDVVAEAFAVTVCSGRALALAGPFARLVQVQ